MTEEKERSFINKIEELEKSNRELQKKNNELQGLLTNAVNENTALHKEFNLVNGKVVSLKKQKKQAEVYKYLFLCMIKGMENDG